MLCEHANNRMVVLVQGVGPRCWSMVLVHGVGPQVSFDVELILQLLSSVDEEGIIAVVDIRIHMNVDSPMIGRL